MGKDLAVWFDYQEAEALLDAIDLHPDLVETYGHQITGARRRLVEALGEDPRPSLAEDFCGGIIREGLCGLPFGHPGDCGEATEP
jgi:hypothetical protein